MYLLNSNNRLKELSKSKLVSSKTLRLRRTEIVDGSVKSVLVLRLQKKLLKVTTLIRSVHSLVMFLFVVVFLLVLLFPLRWRELLFFVVNTFTLFQNTIDTKSVTRTFQLTSLQLSLVLTTVIKSLSVNADHSLRLLDSTFLRLRKLILSLRSSKNSKCN